mmetsp:Transcript_24093/g.56204  ORF Transcript_24093/g.56204 Transcript_24093/m.56204 type:complete len:366 (+) Transcript_24093:20-1117(+)
MEKARQRQLLEQPKQLLSHLGNQLSSRLVRLGRPAASSPAETSRGATLVLIDVQKDFHPGGTLAIPTANEDAHRISEFIKAHGSELDRIVCTLDSHHKLHVAHPCVWRDAEGNRPEPFTQITHEDIKEGKWKPRETLRVYPDDFDQNIFKGSADLLDEKGQLDVPTYVLEYTRRLETKGRFHLTIWPEHCLLGTPGHTMVDEVRAALDQWSDKTGSSVDFVFKGSNNLTEMYSAMEAEVPINKATTMNAGFQRMLQQSTKLIVCGQAKSHCVNYTLRDILTHWPKDNADIYLLTDCTSVVPTFDEAGDKLEQDMKEAGVTVCTSDQVFADNGEETEEKEEKEKKDEEKNDGADDKPEENKPEGDQ